MKDVIAIVAVGGVMLGGFALSAQEAATTQTTTATTAQPVTMLSISEIAEIALAQKAGTITEIELDRDQGQNVYEVKVRTADGAKAKVMIGAETGEVIAITERTASRMGKWWGKDHDRKGHDTDDHRKHKRDGRDHDDHDYNDDHDDDHENDRDHG